MQFLLSSRESSTVHQSPTRNCPRPSADSPPARDPMNASITKMVAHAIRSVKPLPPHHPCAPPGSDPKQRPCFQNPASGSEFESAALPQQSIHATRTQTQTLADYSRLVMTKSFLLPTLCLCGEIDFRLFPKARRTGHPFVVSRFLRYSVSLW